MMYEVINRIVIGIVCLGIFIIPAAIAGNIESHYNRQGQVYDVDYQKGEVFVADESGREWSFYGKGYRVGDEVTMKIYNNHTDSIISDDVIKKVKVNSR